MIEKNKIDEKISQTSDKKKFFGKFLLLILFFIFGVYIFFQNQGKIFNEEIINSRKVQNKDIHNEELKQMETFNNQKSNQKKFNDGYTFGPESPILSFGQKIEEDNVLEIQNNPYEEEIEKEESELDVVVLSSKQSDELENFEDYRHYLHIFSKLLVKLIENKPYGNELGIVVTNKFPKNLEDLLSTLKRYNDLLESDVNTQVKLLPFDSKIFNKFIKITKNKEKVRLKCAIFQEINTLLEYVYSTEMQEQFAK